MTAQARVPAPLIYSQRDAIQEETLCEKEQARQAIEGRNRLVWNLEIPGNNLTRDLPAGSEV